MVARDWLIAGLLVVTIGSGALYLARNQLRRAALRAVHRFRTRLARYQLQQHRIAKEVLNRERQVVRGGARIEDVWDRAWLEYYANSIAHLVAIGGPRLPFHKEHDRQTDLPRLRTSPPATHA